MRPRTALVVLFLVLFSFPLLAQLPPPEFGTGVASAVSLHAYAFQSFASGASYADNGFGYRWISSGGLKTFVAPVQLPSGVTITSIGFDYCDSAAAGDYTVYLYDSYGDNLYNTISTFSPPDRIGCGYAFSPTLNYDFDTNSGHLLSLYVLQPNVTDGSAKFRGAEVYYRRRVSPAPAVATFTDVPTSHLFFQYIEALAASGITSGCTGNPNPQFCPDAPLTRGQMAVFLSRALGLHFAY